MTEYFSLLKGIKIIKGEKNKSIYQNKKLMFWSPFDNKTSTGIGERQRRRFQVGMDVNLVQSKKLNTQTDYVSAHPHISVQIISTEKPTQAKTKIQTNKPTQKRKTEKERNKQTKKKTNKPEGGIVQ